MKRTQDLHVVDTVELQSPKELKYDLPLSDASAEFVSTTRDTIKKILLKKDPRMLLIVGPCSIHDEQGALDYACRLKALSDDVSDSFVILMRVYFEKPRTTVGWKGYINDPHLDGTLDVAQGLRKARSLLIQITDMGLGTASEFLDPIVPQYIADIVGWVAIGARTTESQTHREMASGLSMPVGFKNSTNGNLQVAINAMKSSRIEHSFLGINQDGCTSIIKTSGNIWGHVILRGGAGKTNYDAQSVAEAQAALEEAGLPPRLMIDCNHENSNKQPERQPEIMADVIEQRVSGNDSIMGIMMESNIHFGNQKVPVDLSELKYGVSITDGCLDWERTETAIREAHEKLSGVLTAAV